VQFTENCCVVVPEPNSLSLLLVGMLGFAGATWRQSRRGSSKTRVA